MDGQERGGVRVTGRGWVGAEGARTEVGVEGARPGGGDAESSGSEVGEGDGDEYGGDLAGLAAEVGWEGCRIVATIRATLESKVEK